MQSSLVPHFLPDVTVSWNHECVYFRGSSNIAVKSSLAVRISQYIDGVRSLGEIASAVGDDVSGDQVYSVTKRLAAIKVLDFYATESFTEGKHDTSEFFWGNMLPLLVKPINDCEVTYLKSEALGKRLDFSLQKFLSLAHCARTVRVTYPSLDRRSMCRSFEDDSNTIRRHYDSGGTICLEGIECNDSYLNKLANGLKSGLGYSGLIDCRSYLSGSGSGYTPHFDSRSVLTFQIEGNKDWLVDSAPAVKYPQCNAGQFADGSYGYFRSEPQTLEWENFPLPSFPAGAQSVRLSPGDVLFVPAGVWHSAEAVGHSLSLTFTLNYESCGSLKDLLLRALALRLDSMAELRRTPSVGICISESDLPMPTATRESIREAISLLQFDAASLAVDDIAPLWRKLVETVTRCNVCDES